MQRFEWKVQELDIPTHPSDVITRLLALRHIEDEEYFFNASMRDIVPEVAELFDKSILETVRQVITNTMDNNLPIVIHGDYDADGICATAILWETLFRDIGYKNVHPFIPHREHHGYGLSRESLDEIRSSAPQCCIVSVDCGISARDSVVYGEANGLSFIITDHHTIQEGKLPQNVPILHTYKLCGAGISWALSLLLRQWFLGVDEGESYKKGLDLVALATIADIQSVLGYNRAIIKEGLEILSQTERIGLKEILLKAGIRGKKLGTYEVGWLIAPRLNALGRLEHALDSLRLLLTTDPTRASELAAQMEQVNAERQSVTMRAVEEAIAVVQKRGWDSDFAIVVDSEEWHEGILGLIAGKLVEHFYVPTIVLGKSNGVYKGSARSVLPFNIIDAIRQHKNLLIDVGGHAMAAGLSIESNQIDAFRRAILQTAKESFGEVKPQKALNIDMNLPADLISVNLVMELETLAPHGVDNPKPLFLVPSLTILHKKTVGAEGKHLSLTLGGVQSEIELKAIWFGQGGLCNELVLGQTVDAVASLELDTYRQPVVQLKIKDIS